MPSNCATSRTGYPLTLHQIVCSQYKWILRSRHYSLVRGGVTGGWRDRHHQSKITSKSWGRSRNFHWGAQTLFKKKSSGTCVPLHSQAPFFCKNKGVRSCLCKNKRGCAPRHPLQIRSCAKMLNYHMLLTVVLMSKMGGDQKKKWELLIKYLLLCTAVL